MASVGGHSIFVLHLRHDFRKKITLEQRVIPAFADRKKWSRMMAESVKSTRVQFSSERMIGEYFARLYAYPLAGVGAK